MSFNGEYTSLADACGEGRDNAGRGWVAGIDFDPSDPEEMETMKLVWEREAYDTAERLRRENESLRNEIHELRERIYGPSDD